MPGHFSEELVICGGIFSRNMKENFTSVMENFCACVTVQPLVRRA